MSGEDELQLPTLVLLSSSKTSAKVKKSLMRESPDEVILFLHSLLSDVLFGKLSISESSTKALSRYRAGVYHLVSLKASPLSLRGEFAKNTGLRILSLLASAALPSLLSTSDIRHASLSPESTNGTT